jgi:hypothetical protein
MKNIEVEGIDNRGRTAYPFGFVDFKDERRVAFTYEAGVVDDVTGGWGPVTAKHVELAEKVLREKKLIKKGAGR